MAGSKAISDRAAHFIAQVPSWGREDGCWEWGRYTDKVGYGRFYNGSKVVGAHQFSWVMTNGELPAGKQINHACDNRKCVRPDHLWAGTQAENIRDMVLKGRSRAGKPECRRGHMLEGQNVRIVITDGAIRRYCRRCDVIRHQNQRKASA